jgi:hypothetical protein
LQLYSATLAAPLRDSGVRLALAPSPPASAEIIPLAKAG